MTHKLEIDDICRITIRKFDPTRDPEPYFVTYDVPYSREMRVLEALDYIVEELGESLAYQWFCGTKKCGGCGIRVNDRPVLACWEPAQEEMVIEPMGNLPVIRDLVIDRTRYERDLLKMMPWLQRNKEYPGFPEPLSPADMGNSIELMHCIDCLLCTSVCPAYNETSSFVGPAPLVQLARFALDPRDGGPRAELAVKEGHIKDCVNCYECVEACPCGINVLEHAIDPLRRLITEKRLGDIAHHNHVFRDLVVEEGIISPSVLLFRSRGWRSISDLPLAVHMWIRGRLSMTKVIGGLMNRGQLETQNEITQLARAAHSPDDWKAQQ